MEGQGLACLCRFHSCFWAPGWGGCVCLPGLLWSPSKGETRAASPSLSLLHAAACPGRVGQVLQRELQVGTCWTLTRLSESRPSGDGMPRGRLPRHFQNWRRGVCPNGREQLGEWLQAQCFRGESAGSGPPRERCCRQGWAHGQRSSSCMWNPCTISPLRRLTPALPPPGLPQTCSTHWACEHTSAPRVGSVVTGNPQNSGAGCCRPGVCLPRPVGQREAGRRWAPQDAPTGPDKPDGAPGQGLGSQGSLGSSSLGPRIHLPRFTDEETDAERDTAHAGLEPGLEPRAPALGPLCTRPGAQMAAAGQKGWGRGTPAPRACATSTSSRHYKASGCVCWRLQPRVGGCCSLAAQTLPPLVQVPPVTTWTMAVLMVGAWEAVPEIGLGKAWEKGAWGTTGETYFGSLPVLHPQRATGTFGSKVLSSPVPVPSPAVFASVAASPASILHGWPRSGTQPSSWSPWLSSRPPPPPCCPLGPRPGMVVTGVWPLLVLCLQEKTCPSVRPMGTPGDLSSPGSWPVRSVWVLCCGAGAAPSVPQ